MMLLFTEIVSSYIVLLFPYPLFQTEISFSSLCHERDVMWNKIGGSIPKEIGNITSLKLLWVEALQILILLILIFLSFHIGNMLLYSWFFWMFHPLSTDWNIYSFCPQNLPDVGALCTGSYPFVFLRMNYILLFSFLHHSFCSRLLNGNNLTGPLPEEIGYLPHLDRIQIDQNHISGPLPKSFANLNRTKHL